MHKFILWCFKRLYDLEHIITIFLAFLIFSTVLYYIETAMNVKWNWLNFIKPLIDSISGFTATLLPLKLNDLVESFNVNFISAITLFAILIILVKYIFQHLDKLQILYENAYINHKANYEKNFNKKLTANMQKAQKKISQYMVLIHTDIKKKFSNQLNKINIDEQNKIMNDFIYEKTGKNYQAFNGDFLYYFDDFDKIDSTLEILFKIIKSNSPLDYSMCILSGTDLEKLELIAELKQTGKITMNIDTVLRYKINKIRAYETQCVGLYQKENGTIEIHEFQTNM